MSKLPRYEPLERYLAKLTFKIERALQALPHRLESFEKSAAILQSSLDQLNPSDFWFFIASVELARSKRLLAL